MKSILAAKLYKASLRQGQIQATMSDPNNVGLMTQLARYLDEEYRTPENLTGKSAEELRSEVAHVEEDDAKNEGFLRESSGGGGGGGGHISGLPEDMDLVDVPESEDDISDLVDDMSEDSSSPDDSAADTADDEPAEAATDLQPIEACSNIDVETIKSSLNGVAESAGVQRAVIKNDELWIYYSDDKNLNNIMTCVIDFLLKAGYSTLEFNRLARSDNAIVFEILQSSTPVEVESDEQG